MLFTDIKFWLFFIFIILIIKINSDFIKSVNLQSSIFLFSSYIFYAFWDWRFLSLIIIVSLQTFYLGKLIYEKPKRKNFLLSISVIINLLIIFYFKYFNFFANEFLNLFSLNDDFILPNIILPVGISFYIFQSLTYIIDIYFRKIVPEINIISYLAYVSFFPQLVAGPIERASFLLPQFKKLKKITVENLYIAAKYILIGLSYKIVIANQLAKYVDNVFINFNSLDGGTLLLGAILFSIQIYCDFCGYSLIAIGTAKVMNITLSKNFDNPYFATSLRDFWRRWHISLSSFFKDYVYIPLGGSRVDSKKLVFRNLLITFGLSGLWHGANWTFIIWGILNGFLLFSQSFIKLKLPKVISWLITFISISFLWILFRSNSISDSYLYIYGIFSDLSFPTINRNETMILSYFIFIDLLLNYYKNLKEYWFNSFTLQNYILVFMFIVILLSDNTQMNFIYFEF